jgi:hypothetical protein
MTKTNGAKGAKRTKSATGIAFAVFVLFALFVCFVPALTAVFIAPHAVFIDHESRSAQVTLGNGGDAPEEVTIDLKFGYPSADSLGTPYIRFVDDPGPEFPSAAGWIRAFPRRIRLEPGDRQTVRLLATPPADLPDGEYWTRLIVTSRGAAVPVATADTAVRAGLELELRLVVAVSYRKGPLTTGVSLDRLDASVAADSLIIWMGVGRQGSAAYLGTARFTVLDTAGATVREWATPISVYYPFERRFVVPLESLPAGPYRLALTLLAERGDLEARRVLPAAAVGDTVGFVVP